MWHERLHYHIDSNGNRLNIYALEFNMLNNFERTLRTLDLSCRVNTDCMTNKRIIRMKNQMSQCIVSSVTKIEFEIWWENKISQRWREDIKKKNLEETVINLRQIIMNLPECMINIFKFFRLMSIYFLVGVNLTFVYSKSQENV